MWHPEPNRLSIGCDMNVARAPWIRATFLIAYFSRVASSAAAGR